MLTELEAVLAAAPGAADRAAYAAAIIEGNCLEKPTASTRRLSNQRLGELYALDPFVVVFRVLRGLWDVDPKARPRSAQVFLDSIPLIRRTPNMATWNEIEARVDPLVEGWFYSARPPLVPLNQDLNEASQGLFARPSKP